MKIMKLKKWAALTLCGVLMLSMLTACQGDSTESESVVQSEVSSSVADPVQAAIQARKDSGEYPKLVIAFPTVTGRPAGADRIQEKLNAYTEEKLGISVELEIMDMASYPQSMTLMLSSGEQADIFNAVSMGYSACANKGYCLDMGEDNLLETYGANIMEVLNPLYIEASKVDGIQYGLPQNRDMASGQGGYVIPKRFLDEIGFDYESMRTEESSDYIYTDIETIDEIYAQLHEKYPDMHVFLPNKSSHLRNVLQYDGLGDNFGVLMDPLNTLEVSNLFESEEFLETCKRYYEWNQNGYISKDALTDTATPQEQIKAGTGISHLCALKPGILQSQEQATTLPGQPTEELVIFQVLDDFMNSGAINGMNWCINSSTEYPVEAMQVLNLLYSDSVAASLLAWGEENVDYVKTDDGHITFPEGVDASNAEFSHSVNWLFPNQYITEVWVGQELNVYEETEKFNDNSKKSKALGFSFDNSSVMTEYTALVNVQNEYINQIMLGFVEPEAALKEMNEKLYAAGLEKYMAEKQKQLDVWAAANGVA